MLLKTEVADMVACSMDGISPDFIKMFGQPGTTNLLNCALGLRSAPAAVPIQDTRFGAEYLCTGFASWGAQCGFVQKDKS